MEKVSFFDKKSIPVSSPKVVDLLRTMTTCCASPDGSVWLGTQHGRLVRLDVTFNLVGDPIQAFPEHQPVIKIKASKQCLVALGRISEDSTSRLCAYHLYRSDEKGTPVLVGSVRVPGDFRATCMDVAHDFSYLAVGCARGQTLVYTGAGFGRQGIKPRILAAEDDDNPTAISAVKFVGKSTLFIATEKDVTSVTVTDQTITVDNTDSSVGKLVKTSDLVTTTSQQQLLIAKNDAIFGFTPGEGNTSAVQLIEKDSEVHLIDSWKQYIVLFHETSSNSGENGWCCLTIIASYPTGGSRIIAGSVKVPRGSDLIGLIPGAFDGHSLVAITAPSHGGSAAPIVLNLREKSVHDQIELLTTESTRLYETALDLAKYSSQPKEVVAEILRKYGDHFFDSGEYEKAVTVYSRSLDLPLESSYVINKFLLSPAGGNKTRYLVEYLKKFSTKQHITLLILCLESLGELAEVKTALSSLPGDTLLELIMANPQQILRFVQEDDLKRIADRKRLLETLLENQEIQMFNQQVNADKAILASLIKESPVLTNAVVSLAINSVENQFEIVDPILNAHVKFCRSEAPSIPPNWSDCSDGVLKIQLELALRSKTNCREIVKEMINRGLSSEAMFLAKSFGAPASIILTLSAALNKPLDALAYPGMALDEVCVTIPASRDLTLNARAIMQRSGQRVDGLLLQTGDGALAIETAEPGSDFGSIKGVLVQELRELEEIEYERKERAENDDIEALRMKSELNLMKRKPIIFNLNDKPCSYCNCPITAELPSSLFRCLHVFHQHCSSGDVCKLCFAESQQHRQILTQRKSAVTDHDELFKRMAGSKRGERFETAMAYLGHGLFSTH